MVLPNVPRFVREADTLILVTKIASLSPENLEGGARLEIIDELTGKALPNVILDGSTKNFKLAPKGSTSIEWKLAIPEGAQALRYKIIAATDQFSDGEESVIPVLSNRILVQESLPLWVSSKSKASFTLSELKNNNSQTLIKHNLTLSLNTAPVWEAIQSLPYLIEYPYECSEQTFARYFANSLGKFLLDENPEISETLNSWSGSKAILSPLQKNEDIKGILIEETPWLREAKNETERRQQMAKIFADSATVNGTKQALDKLEEMQLASGSFPWFAGSGSANLYITQHIVTGLIRLQSLTGDDRALAIIDKGMAYLNAEFSRKHQRIIRDSLDLNLNYIGLNEAQYLYAHALSSKKDTSEKVISAIDFYTNQVYKHWLQLDIQSQAMIAFYAHKAGNTEIANSIINSLKENSISNKEQGVYWKNNTQGWNSWESPIETQAIIIDVFSKITDDKGFIEGMKQWLLAQKRVMSWKSTKATTEAIFALISNQEISLQSSQPVNVAVGTENFSSAGSGNSESVYFNKVWNGEEVKKEMAEISIENPNDNVVWGGLHYQYFENLDNIISSTGPLSIEKSLYKVESNKGEQLRPISKSTPLALGDLVRVRLVINTDRDMEFIHLKDLRASGLEPLNVFSEYKWKGGLGYYESTRDASTNFFIERIPKGTYVFEYDLRVNNQGEFSNGITTIQNMYAPEFSSRTEGLRIKVGN